MIVVDTSVWIDYFNGIESPETTRLDTLLGKKSLATGDLILTEVLQGFRHDADYKVAKKTLTSLTVYAMLGTELAVKSADNFRALRKQGITIRKTAGVIIATFCITHGKPLLFSDKDFVPFAKHLGLRSVI